MFKITITRKVDPYHDITFRNSTGVLFSLKRDPVKVRYNVYHGNLLITSVNVEQLDSLFGNKTWVKEV